MKLNHLPIYKIKPSLGEVIARYKPILFALDAIVITYNFYDVILTF